MDGFGRSCLVLAVLSMMLDPDLPPVVAIEHIQQTRGRAAIQTVKVNQLGRLCVAEIGTCGVSLTQQYNFVMDFQKNLSEFIQIHPPERSSTIF